MKIVVIGATGTIGRRVVEKLQSQHEVVSVGSSSGDYQVDITSVESIKKM